MKEANGFAHFSKPLGLKHFDLIVFKNTNEAETMSVMPSLANSIHQVCFQGKFQIHTTPIEQTVKVNFLKAKTGMHIAEPRPKKIFLL